MPKPPKIVPDWERSGLQFMRDGFQQMSDSEREEERRLKLSISGVFKKNKKENYRVTGNFVCPKYENPSICAYNCEYCGVEFSFPDEIDNQCPTARQAKHIMLMVDEWRRRQGVRTTRNKPTQLPELYYDCANCSKSELQDFCNTGMCSGAPTLTIPRAMYNRKVWMPGMPIPVKLKIIQSECSPYGASRGKKRENKTSVIKPPGHIQSVQ